MNTNIAFQYPTWFVLFCLLLGVTYAFLLYYKEDKFREQASWLTRLLAIFRFSSVTLISLLLLSPLLKSLKTEVKKPVIILAQDQSESIKNGFKGDDTLTYANNFNTLKERLLENFEVKEYAFGASVREGIDFKFEDKTSNISSVLKDVYDLYSSQNLGAIILSSDGIYNEGSNPIYAGNQLNVPIYTVALGDTTPKKDLVLKRVFHNKIAYLGDRFSIQADVTAQNCTNSNTILSVFKIDEGKSPRKLQEFPIRVNEEDFFFTQEVVLEAEQSGVQRYRLTVAEVKGEVTVVNNVQDIFIDVLDARQKILLLAHAPHPDIAAFRQTIAKNKNYELKVDYVKDFKDNLSNYNFVILHQVPSNSIDASSILTQLDALKLPRLYVIGGQSNLPIFNKKQGILTINGNTANPNEVQTTISSNFNLFTIEDYIKKEIVKFPPLTAPFGNFNASVKSQVLLKQKIGTVETDFPLLVFGEENGIKKGVLAAEGVWKWRIFNFLQHQNHDIFEELMGKTIQYLTLKEDKRKFRVSVNKNIFNENENILFDAELYNNSYELINEPDVSLSIRDGEGKVFNYTFNKTETAYTLDAGLLSVGNYTFEGKVNIGGEQLTYNGKFAVQPIQLEAFETAANHSMLKVLGEKFGGGLYYPNNFISIADSIKAQNTIKPIYYSTMQTRSIINLKWIFFLILLLLSVEWFLRRYFGSY